MYKEVNTSIDLSLQIHCFEFVVKAGKGKWIITIHVHVCVFF